MKRSGAAAVPQHLRFDRSPLPNQQMTSSIDWDAVDSGQMAHMNSTLFPNGGGTGDNNANIADDQFQDMSPESAARLLDKHQDENFIRHLNSTDATEFSNLTTRGSAVSVSGINQTIGAYFQSRSQYPRIEKDRDSLLQFQDLLARTKSTASDKPRESLSSFFLGSKSEGQTSEAMINQVMKYCMGMQGTKDQPPANDQTVTTDESTLKNQTTYHNHPNLPEAGADDTFTLGIMDVTAVSSIPSSPPHSTPKRNSGRTDFFGNGHRDRLSLKDIRKSLQQWESRRHVENLRPKFSEASTSMSMYQEVKSFRIPQSDAEKQKDPESPKIPVKEEPNHSPNSSISSSATSTSNVGASASANGSGTGAQIQIYTTHHPSSSASSVISLPPSNTNVQPIVIQVQCSCSNHTNNNRPNSGYPPMPPNGNHQPQYYSSSSACHHQQQQSHQVMTQMVPMMMPMMMPVPVMPCNHPPPGQPPPQAQFQQSGSHNSQCQCRCNSCYK